MSEQDTYMAPDDPTPRSSTMTLRLDSGALVEVCDDAYSDRIRCDHPDASDGQTLGAALLRLATERGRGRVVVFARSRLEEGLLRAGLHREAVMPGYYQGRENCVVMAGTPDPARAESSDPEAVREVDELVLARSGRGVERRPSDHSRRAVPEDAAGVANLITATFDQYPTPSGCADYVEEDIRSGTPYRVVEEEGRIVACASADLVPQARTAELTDCATTPESRGRGHMQALLHGLMDDLRRLGYPTAFTLSRAGTPGVNLAFQRLGFEWRGRMTRSCRIGGGIEDMNVWSRRL